MAAGVYNIKKDGYKMAAGVYNIKKDGFKMSRLKMAVGVYLVRV